MESNSFEKLKENDWKILASPSGFNCIMLGQDLYQWQADALDALIPDGARVAIKTCNESGKTSVLVAGAIIWHMMLYPNSMTVSTAGVYRQVTEQLMPSLRRLLAKSPSWNVTENRVQAPNGSRFVGFSTDDAGKFEGWHTPVDNNGKKSSLLMIVDEAKSVKEDIYEAIERCRPDRLLIASSPGEPLGTFFN